jgi:2-dehydro-3-deoxyphosphogluconate aldolase/(4S)-4-hydroxy-2-oxoglutarate aldolase
MNDPLKFFEEQKIITVIRATEHGDAEAIAKAVLDGGVKIIEFVPGVPQVLKLIETFSKQDGILVGLGCATDGEIAHRAINAGAKYVSSHYTDKNIFTVCRNNGVPVIQGAATITEMMEAYQLGVDLIKIYPVNFLGEAPFIHRIKRSFPFLKLVPSGGIGLENFLDYIRAGATACAVSRSFCDKALIRAHQWPEITERVKQFIQKLESLKVSR